MADFSSAIWNKPAAAAAAADDVVTKSCRFEKSSSSKLTWTPASSSSATSYTISLWAKRGDLGAENCLFHAGTVNGNRGHIRFNSDDTLELACYNGSWFVLVQTTAVFRDPSAFYHICGEINTTNGTAKLYINGVQQTALEENTADSGSTVLPFGANIEHQIGVRGYGSAGYFGGYVADIYAIDSTALDATSFAEEDTTTGQWKPKAYSGSYGDNGFHLDFEDSSDIGNDVSGEGNDFTASNLAASDVMEDTPTDNYCVINPLDKYSGVTLAEGNLKLTSGDYHYARSTFALPSSGQWYWEYYWKDHGYVGGYGISAADFDLNDGPTGKCRMTMGGSWYSDFNTGGLAEFCADQARHNGTNWGTTYEDGDIVMVAVDRDNSKIWFGKNGSWISTSGTPNPATGVDPRDSSVTSTTDWFPTVGTSSTYDGEVYANFGQDPTFAGNKTSGQDTSQSEFYYAPPHGYLGGDGAYTYYSALSTANLPTPTIDKPSEHFNTVLYTGNNSTNPVTGVGFRPDLLWVKARSDTRSHNLVDSVRDFNGTSGRYLMSNDYEVESESAYINSLDSDGFTVSGSEAYINSSSNTYVAWNWLAGTSFEAEAGESTSGSKNVDAGFSIATWTGDDDSFLGSAQTITHGLNPLTPEMIIAKGRTDNNATGSDWLVYHKDLPSGEYLILNDTGTPVYPMSAVIDNIGATSVDFGSDGSSYYFNTGDYGMGIDADTYISYFFASVEGYSKCGSYEGNNSADGPFVYCGFQPRWICVKRIDGIGSWIIVDTARDPYNDTDATLSADTSSAESSYAATSDFDILSNGFKLRHSVAYGYANQADTYIFYAVGQSSKYANAR